MKTMKTFSRRIAALLLVVTVGITALPPAAVSMAAVPAGLGLPVEAVSAVWAASSGFGGAGRSGGGFGGMGGGSSHGGGAGRGR